MPRLTASEARNILTYCGISANEDFHALKAEQIANLLAFAYERKYRKPKNANGSSGRCFHAYVIRATKRP